MTPRKKADTDPKAFNFEETLEKLKSIAETLEDEGTSLETSLQAFEEGIKLTREAQQYLQNTEQKVKMLIEQDGEPGSTDFAEDPDEK